MTPRKFRVAAYAFAGFVLAGLLTAPIAGQDAAGGKTKVIEGKSKQAKRAAKVDFGAAFGLNLAGLDTLGARIDQARATPDPVALALLAKELSIAEAISGKEAAIKSAKLLEAAVKLAQVRENIDELKAVAMLAPENKDLLSQAEKAAKAAEDRKSGERKKGVYGSLHVDSRVNLYITVYVNGQRVGTLSPFGDLYVQVRDPSGVSTSVYGSAPGTSSTWGTFFIGPSEYSSYHLILRP